MNCSAQQPLINEVIYLGHDLEAGQMCDAFSMVTPLQCECGETIRICFQPCGGDGWTSDLFTHQRESVEVDTRFSDPADATRTKEKNDEVTRRNTEDTRRWTGGGMARAPSVALDK